MKYTIPQIYQMAVNAGFKPGAQAAQATAVAWGESGGNDRAINTNGQALGISTDYGLMQVNSKYWAKLNPAADLGNAQQSMNHAFTVFSQSANGFGAFLSTNGSNGNYNYALPIANAFASSNPSIAAGTSSPSIASPSVAEPDSSQFDGNAGISHGSDAFGDPGGAGFSSNDATGSSVTGGTDTFNQGGYGTQNAGDLGGPSNAVAGDPNANNAGGVPGLPTQGTGTFYDTAASPSQTSDATPASASPAPDTGPTTDGTVSPSNATQPNAQSGSGASAGSAPQNQNNSNVGGGTPFTETNASQVASDAGNTVSKALGGLTSGAASDTSAGITAGTGWLGSLLTGGTSLLVRGGFIAAGLVILLLAGLFFFLDAQKSGGPTIELRA